jgi:hypothetical protein
VSGRAASTSRHRTRGLAFPARGQGRHAIRVKGRACRVRWPPDHAARARLIEYWLLDDLVGSLIGEASRKDEDDLVLSRPGPLKDVLQNSGQAHSGERLVDLLTQFASNGVERVLPEFDVTAKKPMKDLSGGFASSDTSSAPSRGRWISTIALTTWPRC